MDLSALASSCDLLTRLWNCVPSDDTLAVSPPSSVSSANADTLPIKLELRGTAIQLTLVEDIDADILIFRADNMLLDFLRIKNSIGGSAQLRALSMKDKR